MSAGAWMMVLATVLALGALLFVIWSLVRSIMTQRTDGRSVWKEFGLGLALTVLFFATWIAHGITEWQTYTDEQLEHGSVVKAGDFFTSFAQSTLENWQSEFLQLFAFVVLAAMYVHKGSAVAAADQGVLLLGLRISPSPDVAHVCAFKATQFRQWQVRQQKDPLTGKARRQRVTGRLPGFGTSRVGAAGDERQHDRTAHRARP